MQKQVFSLIKTYIHGKVGAYFGDHGDTLGMGYHPKQYSKRVGLHVFLCFIGMWLAVLPVWATQFTVESPDKKIIVKVFVDGNTGISLQPVRNGQSVLGPITLGFVLDSVDLGKNINAGRAEYAERDQPSPYCGAFSSLENHYKQLRVPIFHDASGLSFILSVRVYNTGMAFRLNMPLKEPYKFQKEYMEWGIPSSGYTWTLDQGLIPLGSEVDRLGFPLLLKIPEQDLFVRVEELAIGTFPPLALERITRNTWRGAYVFDYREWPMSEEFVSPWRIVEMGNDPMEFPQNPISWRLGESPTGKLEGATWVLPGKGLRLHPEEPFAPQAAQAKNWGLSHVLLPTGKGSLSLSVLAEAGRAARGNGLKLWAEVQAESLQLRSKRMASFIQMKQRGVSGLYIKGLSNDSLGLATQQQTLKDAALLGLMVFLEKLPSATVLKQETPHVMGTSLPEKVLEVSPWDPLSLAQLGIATKKEWRKNGALPSHRLASELLYTHRLSFWENIPDLQEVDWPMDVLQSLPSCWDESKSLDANEPGELLALLRRKEASWYLALLNLGNQKKSIQLAGNTLEPSYYKWTAIHEDASHPGQLLREEAVIRLDKNVSYEVLPKAGFVAVFEPVKLPEDRITCTAQGGQWKTGISVEFTAKGSIHYTLDGSPPSPLSPVYTGRIYLEKPGLIQAATFGPDGETLALKQVRFK